MENVRKLITSLAIIAVIGASFGGFASAAPSKSASTNGKKGAIPVTKNVQAAKSNSKTNAAPAKSAQTVKSQQEQQKPQQGSMGKGQMGKGPMGKGPSDHQQHQGPMDKGPAGKGSMDDASKMDHDGFGGFLGGKDGGNVHQQKYIQLLVNAYAADQKAEWDAQLAAEKALKTKMDALLTSGTKMDHSKLPQPDQATIDAEKAVHDAVKAATDKFTAAITADKAEDITAALKDLLTAQKQHLVLKEKHYQAMLAAQTAATATATPATTTPATTTPATN